MAITPGDGGTGGTSSPSNACWVSNSDQTEQGNLLSRVAVLEALVGHILGIDVTAIDLSDISQSPGNLLSTLDGVLGTAVGYQPYALQIGVSPLDFTNPVPDPDQITLLPNEVIAVPFALTSKMKLGAVLSRWHGSGVNNSAWEVHIYKERADGILEKVASCEPGDWFIPSAYTTANRAAPYPTLLLPGVYHLAWTNISPTPGISPGLVSVLAKPSTGIFYNRDYKNWLRVGTATAGADTLNISTWMKMDRIVQIGMVGVMGNEPLPYTFDEAFFPPV